jgi:hypothetical protein
MTRVEIDKTPGRCQMAIAGVQCSRAATAVWDSGCVHEHLEIGIELCDGHPEVIMTLFECIKCAEGDNPHVCRVTMKARESTSA